MKLLFKIQRSRHRFAELRVSYTCISLLNHEYISRMFFYETHHPNVLPSIEMTYNCDLLAYSGEYDFHCHILTLENNPNLESEKRHRQ